ncbi:MAG: PQQ-binding-like beta-propeller repeat protein [Caldisericaceae bacterium]
MKRVIVFLLTILTLFSLFRTVIRENGLKADEQPIWPMVGYNSQRTSQCPYDTSWNNGLAKWKYSIGFSYSSPAIGSDGTIYVGSEKGLFAINPDGTMKRES